MLKITAVSLVLHNASPARISWTVGPDIITIIIILNPNPNNTTKSTNYDIGNSDTGEVKEPRVRQQARTLRSRDRKPLLRNPSSDEP